MKISNKLYDILKWLCLICIPALTSFLGKILPSLDVPEDTVALVMRLLPEIATLIGICIGISNNAYKIGNIEAQNDKADA